MITNLSHSATVNRDGRFGDRFWYWNGASGRAYIHSVYRLGECPPLPGAIYIAVRRDASGRRTVCAISRFSSAFDGLASLLPSGLARRFGVNEVHVHLLAETEAEIDEVIADLSAALLPRSSRRAPAKRSPLGLLTALMACPDEPAYLRRSL
ncbi:hypothetical protein FHS85_002289 [Rhodoligotrophos appendicifer]|uniref:hypothetical protein n=1 Tax=Rhodoligotrophos appendicifer TaxID=987056 RepID=UPI0011864784|nr:hypothetical protein [Rhodoligotrophos appendicifer]